MECNQKANLRQCTFTYEPCPCKGICCECIAYHRQYGQLPGSVFPPEVERTYDRSAACFVRTYNGRA